jgi:hypothetical protein
LFSILKKGFYCLLKIAILEFPCDNSMYLCIIIQLGLDFFFFSPLLMAISTGLKILYSFLYRKYIMHTHLNFFYPSSPTSDLPIA